MGRREVLRSPSISKKRTKHQSLKKRTNFSMLVKCEYST